MSFQAQEMAPPEAAKGNGCCLDETPRLVLIFSDHVLRSFSEDDSLEKTK